MKGLSFYFICVMCVFMLACSGIGSVVRVDGFGLDALGDYDIKEYKAPTYSFRERRYLFLSKDLLSGDLVSGRNYGYYYRVYYSQDTGLVVRVDEYRHHQLMGSVYYKYGDKLELEESRYYLESGRLFIVGLYRGGILYKRRQLMGSGRVKYVSLIDFIDKGMREVWYTPFGQLSYVVEYDSSKRVVRYSYYRGGLVNLFIDSRYNELGVLLRQDYYNRGSKLLHFIRYYYDSRGYLERSMTYKGSMLVSRVNFDLKSRELRREEYARDGSLISYSTISYSDGIRETRWFDKNSFMVRKSSHNVYNELIFDIEYTRGARERKLVRNYFEGGRKRKSELYRYGKLSVRSFFSDGGVIEREERFRGGNLVSYFKFVYNDKFQLLKKEEFSSQGYYTRSFHYFYNRSGFMVMEKLKEANVVVGVRLFEYSKHLSLNSIKIFDEKDRLVRREFLDSLGRVYKVENGLGGILDNVVKYRYKGDGDRVFQEEHYDRYDNLIRVLTFVYNEDGSISREDGFDGKKQYLGSVLYEYNEDGGLVRQLMLNHLKEAYEAVYFDEKTGIIKGRERYKGVGS